MRSIHTLYAGHTTAQAKPPAPASGAIVMAGGIFILAAMQRIPDATGPPTKIAALVLLAIWAVLARFFAQALRAGQLPGPRHATVFAMGTWVAATAVLADTMMLAFPGFRMLALCFSGLALCLWLWFLLPATRSIGELLVERRRVHITGTVLLTTVSTQSLVLAGQRSLPTGMPYAICLLLLVAGLAYYAVGAVLIGFSLAVRRARVGIQDWRAPRCILHGALSITGLAGLRSGVFPSSMLVALWLLAAALFVVVESMEVIRLGLRVHAHGWRGAVVIYHPAQWARNFTFGMFYAFTLALSLDRTAARDAPWAAACRQWLVGWAQYAVLGLLVGEAVLLVAYLSHARWLSGRRLS